MLLSSHSFICICPTQSADTSLRLKPQVKVIVELQDLVSSPQTIPEGFNSLTTHQTQQHPNSLLGHISSGYSAPNTDEGYGFLSLHLHSSVPQQKVTERD